MRVLSCLLSASVCVMAFSSQAAMLRPFSKITTATVRLTDLFDDLGPTPDRVLGPAPAPGLRIVVSSPQLAAIARDFNVDWRPTSGSEQAVIERRGDVISPGAINAALRRSLVDAGAPADCDVSYPELQPIVVSAGTPVAPDISQVSYEAQNGHFTAMLSMSGIDMAGTQVRLSGQVVPMVQTAVASRRLVPGSTVGEGDIQLARVRLASLHGGSVLLPDAALGMSVRHVLAAGQALGAGDLARPLLVQRGATVRMTLESDGIALSAQGTAIEAGGRGERIKVENPASHLLVDAEITGPGEVRVAPHEAAITLVSAQ